MAYHQTLTHAQKVTRLYRNTLRHMLSWTVYREIWRRQAVELRAKFDKNKNVDLYEGMRLLEEGEKQFERIKHPDPYIDINAPDGTKWERNPPPPPHALELLPEEKQWLDQWKKYGPR